MTKLFRIFARTRVAFGLHMFEGARRHIKRPPVGPTLLLHDTKKVPLRKAIAVGRAIGLDARQARKRHLKGHNDKMEPFCPVEYVKSTRDFTILSNYAGCDVNLLMI